MPGTPVRARVDESGDDPEALNVDEVGEARVFQDLRLITVALVAKHDAGQHGRELLEALPEKRQDGGVRRAALRDHADVGSGVRVVSFHLAVVDGARDEKVRAFAQNVLVGHFQGQVGPAQDDALRVYESVYHDG